MGWLAIMGLWPEERRMGQSTATTPDFSAMMAVADDVDASLPLDVVDDVDAERDDYVDEESSEPVRWRTIGTSRAGDPVDGFLNSPSMESAIATAEGRGITVERAERA